MSWLTSWWRKDEKKDNQEEEKKKESIVKYIKKKKEYRDEDDEPSCDIIEYPDKGIVENVYNGPNPSWNENTPIPNWFIYSEKDLDPVPGQDLPRKIYYAYILYREISDITGYKITIQNMAVNQGKQLYDPKTNVAYYNNMMTYQQVGGHGSGTKDIGNNYEQHIKVYIKQDTIASIGASLAFKMSTVGTTGEIYYKVVFDTEKVIDTDYFTNNTSFIVDPIIVNRFVRPNALCKYRTYSLNIVASGKFPSYFYENYLPLSNKWVYAYDDPFDGDSIPNGKVLTTDQLDGVNRNKTHHIDSINNTWYDNTITVESTLDLLYNRDINFDYFKNVYIKTVKLSTYYRGMKLPFKYWDRGVLTDSIIEWNSDAYADVVDVKWNEEDHILEIYFKEQEDNFLDPYINSSNNLNLSLAHTNVFPIDESFAEEVMKAVTYESETGVTPPVSIIVNSVTKRIDNNEFNFSFYTTSPTKVGIRYKTGTGNIFRPTDITYSIKDINCIKNGELTISEINDVQQIVFVNNDLIYENLYLTNLKSSTTHLANNVNLIVKGDITEIYENFPSGVDTINEAPVPGEYLESESYMDLSAVTNVELTKFGELDNGKFTSQKIYLTKIIVNESNKTKVENSEMESRNKSTIDDTYALTIVEVGEIPDEDTIVTDITFPEDKPDTVRLELDGTEPDFLNSCVSGSILTINLDNALWQTFYNDGNTKSELELYVKQMVIKDNNKNVEFFRNDVWYIHIKYGSQHVEYYSTSFTTHLGTLNITYTESESDSSIKPITYSSNGTVKAIGLQSKDSYINYIETINSINTLVIGDDNECKIGNNRITLVNDGLIPKKMYTDILPIGETEEHYVDSEGNITSSGIARLVAINEPPENEYLTYESSMNLIDVKDVSIEKFGTITGSGNQVKIDKQNVFLSSILVYANETNKKVGTAGLMSRNVMSYGRTLGDGETPNYAPTDVDYQRDDIVDSIVDNYKLFIKKQNCNNFLKSVTETDSGTGTVIKYTDVYLNQACSSSFQENSENTLRVSILYLLNEYTITFNGEENMGNLRIHYLKSNPEEGDKVDDYGYVEYVPSNPTYEVVNLYIASGEYEEDTSNLIPHPVEWTDRNGNHKVFNRTEYNGITTSISLDLKYKKDLTYVVKVLTTPYCINTLVSNQDYFCGLIVSGEIPQWVFKDLLPLPKSINADNSITITDTGKSLYMINKPLESYVGVSDSTMSEIDLTNVADLDVLNRVYLEGEKKIDSDGNDNKVFFVNKVKLLKRFEGKIDIDGDDALFQYYKGMTRNPSMVEFDEENDWALKLPECYERCEVSGTELTVKFGEYLQIDYKDENEDMIYDCLFRKLHGNLDISMKTNSNLNLDNIITLNIYLDILKYISWLDVIKLADTSVIWVIYNKNGFLETKEFGVDNIKQKINYCYLIHETYENTKELNRDNILIKPVSDALDQQNNIILHDYFFMSDNMEINHLKCTNVCQKSDPNSNEEFPEKTEVNLLISGDVTDWVNKHFKDSDKILPIMLRNGVEKETENGEYECEILSSNYEETDYFKVTSINALPAPGIGIDNSKPEDQCSLNLEDFINPPEP